MFPFSLQIRNRFKAQISDEPTARVTQKLRFSTSCCAPYYTCFLTNKVFWHKSSQDAFNQLHNSRERRVSYLFPLVKRESRCHRTFRNEKHLGLLSSETIVLMHTNCEVICCYVTEKPLKRGHLLPADTFFRNRLVSCKIFVRKPLCTGQFSVDTS